MRSPIRVRGLIAALAPAALAPAILAFAAPTAAAQPATPWRASGSEPFWAISNDGATLRFTRADGPSVIVATPRPIVGINGERFETRRLALDITHVRCTDAMNGRQFRDTVRLVVDGRRFSGCGGEVVGGGTVPPTTTLLDGEWRIVLLDRRPLGAGAPARVSFEDGRISGDTGCNRFTGTFRFGAGRLNAGPLATTRRACPPPLGAQERRLLAVLGERLSVSRNRAGKLVLTARSGHRLTLAPITD
jgi:heat shock protein HslJ